MPQTSRDAVSTEGRQVRHERWRRPLNLPEMPTFRGLLLQRTGYRRNWTCHVGWTSLKPKRGDHIVSVAGNKFIRHGAKRRPHSRSINNVPRWPNPLKTDKATLLSYEPSRYEPLSSNVNSFFNQQVSRLGKAFTLIAYKRNEFNQETGAFLWVCAPILKTRNANFSSVFLCVKVKIGGRKQHFYDKCRLKYRDDAQGWYIAHVYANVNSRNGSAALWR